MDQSAVYLTMAKIVLDSTIFAIVRYTALITPVQAALRAMASRVIALEGAAKFFIAFAMPDLFNRLLEDIGQHALIMVFARAAVAEGGEAAREDIAARRYVCQRVGAATAHPGTLAEVARAALGAMGASDGGLITLYYGGAQNERDAERLSSEVRSAFPAAELEFYYGGQSDAEYWISLDE